jgi:putative Holliday junction resolvase
MKIKLLEECRDQMPKDVRLMGLDLGTKTIGVAISDAAQSIVTPVTTVKRTKFSCDILELEKHIKDFEIGGYILGWPLNEDGRRGARCDMVMSFADEMTKNPEIFGVYRDNRPFIALWDEGLSTQSVDNFLDNRVDMGKKSKRGAKDSGLLDMLAAQVILQSALDGF